MALSELQNIRALLIAQTDEPEARRAPGLLQRVGSLLGARPPVPQEPARPPLRLVEPPAVDFIETSAEDALLLDWEPDPDLFVPLELPPSPRAEFGQRSPRPYLPHDSVLRLDRVVDAAPRRLTLLTDTGEAVGELFLKPEEPPLRAVFSTHEHEAPYFPGDLDETHLTLAPLQSAPAPRRSTRLAAPAAAASQASVRFKGLGTDLLDALALTLAREAEALSDRLMQVGATGRA